MCAFLLDKCKSALKHIYTVLQFAFCFLLGKIGTVYSQWLASLL